MRKESRSLKELLAALPSQERWTKRPEFMERAYARDPDFQEAREGSFRRFVVLDVGSAEIEIDVEELKTLRRYFGFAAIPHDCDDALLY